MRKPGLLLMFVLLLMLYVGMNVSSCKRANHAGGYSAEDSVGSLDSAMEVSDIPSSVGDIAFDDVDTVCVVGREAYCLVYETEGKNVVLFNDGNVLVADPTLRVDSFAPGKNHMFYVSVVGNTQLVDFSDRNSIRALSGLSQKLSSFHRYSLDTVPDIGRYAHYSIEADFPVSSVRYADRIGRWLANVIASTQELYEIVTLPNASELGFSKLHGGGWTYKGDVLDYKRIAKCVASVYFAALKEIWDNIDDEYYPSGLSSALNLRARHLNERLVTYQLYTFEYSGGAHGGYQERLVSFDFVHNREIDFKYLFKPNSEKEVLDVLLEEAQKTYRYKEWQPDILKRVVDKDENGNPTGIYNFPCPGLSEEGVVFSFNPYSISCFAAGAFHFTIPYDRIKHCLTERGKWLVESVER